MFTAIGADWFTAWRQRVSVISINGFHPTILANNVSICVANVTDCPLKEKEILYKDILDKLLFCMDTFLLYNLISGLVLVFWTVLMV